MRRGAVRQARKMSARADDAAGEARQRGSILLLILSSVIIDICYMRDCRYTRCYYVTRCCCDARYAASYYCLLMRHAPLPPYGASMRYAADALRCF